MVVALCGGMALHIHGLQKCNPQGGGAISLDEWMTHVHMDSRKCPNNKVIIESFVFTGYIFVTRKEMGQCR